MKQLLPTLILLILVSCSTKAIFIPSNFQEESCQYSYCLQSEDSKAKEAGLKLVEIVASIYNIELDLKQGICTDIYEKRELDYRYVFKTPYEVCIGDNGDG